MTNCKTPQNPLPGIISNRKADIHAGIPSYCTANPVAIEAVLKQAFRFSGPVLIEGTSNQVNQFGGYTGMKPADYRDFVYAIADKIGFDRSRLILGGDHLGPQPFQNLPEATAIPYAVEMVREYVLAGFTKIHLDTSMRVADDDKNTRLSDEVIARRGAILMEAAESAFKQLQESAPDAVHPVFVIGSEVPIPGGAQTKEEMTVTSGKDFENTLKAYRQAFDARGIGDLWQYVIAVVVQPGVEFSDTDVHMYVPEEAAELCAALKKYPGMVFEGHSTDYQSAEALRAMTGDGVAILKVGPALTFAAREALFALEHIEKEVVTDKSALSGYSETVDRVMCEKPADWAKYYKGDELQKALKRKYSFSDRSRYYMGDAAIVSAMQKLLENLRGREIPMGLLHQYMPLQYIEVRDGRLPLEPYALVLDAVRVVCDDYNNAAGIITCIEYE